MRIVSTSEDLTQAARRLSTSEFVAVDTEFMREQTFWPQLCLIQLAGPDDEAIIDPLAPGLDLEPFYELMADQRVVKVFHAARQDIEIVYVRGRPRPAARVRHAGRRHGVRLRRERQLRQPGQEASPGVDLDKSSRFTDWSRRPLSDKQLVYALGDVTHLRDVYRHLKAELEQDGRADWLDEEMADAHRSEDLRDRIPTTPGSA